MKILSVMFFFIFSVMAYAAEKHETIPSEFHGYWSAELKFCKVDHLYNLSINSNSVQFYESGGPVISVVTQGNNELALITELSGEGDTWLNFVHLHLSKNNDTITDISDPYSKNQLVRYRCK